MSKFSVESTRRISGHKVSLLGYGFPKIGKTSLALTIPSKEDSEILYIGVDPGYMALRNRDFHVVLPPGGEWTIKLLEDLQKEVRKLAAEGKYKWCIIDGVDDIGTIVLNEKKGTTTNLMKAYGEMADWCEAWIKGMRDIEGISTLFITHIVEKEEGEGEKSRFYPSIPGRKLLYEMDRYFDIIFCMRWVETEAGPKRMLQVSPEADPRYVCGDRSGSLMPLEEPDLGKLLEKIEKNVPGSTRPHIEKHSALLIELKDLFDNSESARRSINSYLQKASVKSPRDLGLESLEQLVNEARKTKG